MAVNRDRFLAMVDEGEVRIGDQVTIVERSTFTVVNAGNGRVRLDREENGSHESLMLNTKMPSKRLAEAEFEVTTPVAPTGSYDDDARLREHVQQHLER